MSRNNKNYSDEIHDMDYAEHVAFTGFIEWHDKNVMRLNAALVILVFGVLFCGYIAYNKYSHHAVINQEGVPVFELREIDKDF